MVVRAKTNMTHARLTAWTYYLLAAMCAVMGWVLVAL